MNSTQCELNLGIQANYKKFWFTVPGAIVGKGRPRFTTQGRFVRAYTPKKTRDYEQKIATVQATETEKPKAEEKPAGKKKSAKETKKPQTLEEQIATVPDNLKTPIDRIFKYLMSVPGMDEKMRNPKKSITDMWQFVESNARKKATGHTACIEDEVVYGWAVHYYDEDDPK